MNEKTRIECICNRCNVNYSIEYRTFKKRELKNSPSLCQKCIRDDISKKNSITQKIRWKNMTPKEREINSLPSIEGHKKWRESLSDEEKKQRTEQLNEKNKYYRENMSIEQKEMKRISNQKASKIRWEKENSRENQSIKSKKYWKELPENELNRRSKLFSDILKNYWKTVSPEKRKKHIENISKGEEEFWSRVTPEYRKMYSERTKNQIANYSEEKKKDINKKRSNSIKKFISLLTDDELYLRIKPMIKGYEVYYNHLSNEEKKLLLYKLHEGWKEWWSNLSEEEFEEWMNKRNNTHYKHMNDGNLYFYKTELLLAEDLKKYNINFQFKYSNILKHSDFSKLFPYNPIINGFTDWQHWWDFIIYTKQGNILVDVDGSAHIIDYQRTHYTGFTYSNLRYMKFKDSQRPYQTDNMDAYIIEAYDDKLKNDTKVLDVRTNTYITYKEFLNMIQLINYSKKELREILS